MFIKCYNIALTFFARRNIVAITFEEAQCGTLLCKLCTAFLLKILLKSSNGYCNHGFSLFVLQSSMYGNYFMNYIPQ